MRLELTVAVALARDYHPSIAAHEVHIRRYVRTAKRRSLKRSHVYDSSLNPRGAAHDLRFATDMSAISRDRVAGLDQARRRMDSKPALAVVKDVAPFEHAHPRILATR